MDRQIRRRALLVGLMASLALLSAGAGAYTLALFTDVQTAGSNSFSTGTIDISSTPASAFVASSNMMPGDSVDATLTISNAGTGQLRYAMTASATNADGKNLAGQLTVTVRTRDVATDSCTAFDGTQLYSGSASAAAFGNATSGSHSGDRTLAGASTEKLCFRVSLPSGTSNSYAGAATTTTFTFAAEQTTNKP